MAIGEDKTRTNITFPKELKAKLEELAQKDGRSFNNLVIKILSDYVEDTHKQGILYFPNRRMLLLAKLPFYTVNNECITGQTTAYLISFQEFQNTY